MMRALLLSLSIGLAGCSLLEPNSPNNTLPAFFNQALENWEEEGPPRYEYTYSPEDGSTEYLILVERGEVTRVREAASGAAVSLSLGYTMEDLFDRIAASYLSGAYLISAEYTPQTGYPRSAFVDPDRNVDADEFGWTITTFRTLLPCTGC